MKKLIIPIAVLVIFIFSGCEELGLENDPRDELVGTWNVNENFSKKANKEVYSVEIEKDFDDSTKIFIVNFFNTGALNGAEATLSGSVITLASNQNIGGGFTLVSGAGTIANKTINWTYQVDEGSGIPYNVTAEYTKY